MSAAIEKAVTAFLDELPPYLANAVAVPVGNADLGVVTTTALANLFIAVAEMDNDTTLSALQLAQDSVNLPSFGLNQEKAEEPESWKSRKNR